MAKQKILFLMVLFFNYLNSAEGQSALFHCLVLDNFKQIILYSNKETMYNMRYVCKSLQHLIVPLCNTYGHYNYLTFLVGCARRIDTLPKVNKQSCIAELKNHIDFFCSWGYENILDWMPRFIPNAKTHLPFDIETKLAAGDRKWINEQEGLIENCIISCRERCRTYVDLKTKKVIQFYKNSNKIVKYYKNQYHFDCEKEQLLFSVFSKVIEENNIAMATLLIIQNKDLFYDIPSCYDEYKKMFVLKKLILLYGINEKNKWGNTLLVAAVNNRNIDIIRFLLQYNADIYIKNKYHLDALELAPTVEIKNILFSALGNPILKKCD